MYMYTVIYIMYARAYTLSCGWCLCRYICKDKNIILQLLASSFC